MNANQKYRYCMFKARNSVNASDRTDWERQARIAYRAAISELLNKDKKPSEECYNDFWNQIKEITQLSLF